MKRSLLLTMVVFGCLLFAAVLVTQKNSVADMDKSEKEVEQKSEEQKETDQEETDQEETEQEETDEEDEHGGVIIYEEPVKAIFDHDLHLETGMECDSCHDDLFEEETGAAESSGDFTMAAFREGKYCGSCHDGDTAFHIYSQCESCHSAPTDPIYFTKPVLAVIFDHKIHVGREKIKCEECHKEVFNMKRGAEKLTEDFVMANIYCEGADVKFCGVCHNNERAFADNTRCTVCHIGVKDYNKIMAKKAGKSVKDEKKGH